MIKIKNLVKKFGKKIAVNNLNLNIPKGSLFGFTGLNGAGKTTTLNMISTLTIPTHGDIIVNKHSIKTTPNKVRQSIGLLPQDSGFYEHRTVLSHMQYYCKLKGVETIEAQVLIKKVGLEEVQDTNVTQLSHGMKKSLSLGQALIGSPPVLLLDEPFSGLDPLVRNRIRKVIKEYAKKSTIIICSHDLNEIEKLCDRICIANKGKLILEAKVSDIKRKKKSLEEVFLKAVTS